MNHKQQWYLQTMGIDVWSERGHVQLPPENSHETIIPSAEILDQLSVKQSAISNLDWDALQARVSACQACGLHKTRTQTVFGVGNRQADLLIVGEAPGANEDRQGEPFVGRAGKLLDAMLKAIDLQRQDIYIANILKCRPPNNRDPNPEEVATCTPFLQQQMALLKPKLILAVGRIAAHFLLGTNVSLGKLRGQLHYYGEHKIPLIVTYHPAYLLRSPREKSKAYIDLLKAKEILNELPTTQKKEEIAVM